MFKKIIWVSALCFIVNTQIKAQDLLCTKIFISQLSPFDKTARITIKNQGDCIARPLRVYVELHTENEASNPIAQLDITKPFLNTGESITKSIRLSAFKIVRGFSLADATKLVVICDPKVEVTETDEGNNISVKALR